MREPLIQIPLLFVLSAPVQAQVVPVGRFDTASAEPPDPWQLVHPDKRYPPTRFRVMEWDGIPAIEAVAERSMALLARPVEIDLQQTPVLCWQWRIDAPLQTADMQTKSGDDYAARVYISFRLPRGAVGLTERIKLGLARTLYGDSLPDAAVNYVWDNRYPVGTWQPNTYANRVRMLVLQSGASKSGRWIAERRDVLADARLQFGEIDLSAVQLAVASDTDNTGETARAGFADLQFVGRDMPCDFSDPD